MKCTKQQLELLDAVCKGFNFKSSSDTETTITRLDALKAGTVIQQLKDQILLHFPYGYVLKLKSGEKGAQANLTVLRQMLRFHRKRLLSIRKYKWSTAIKISKYSPGGISAEWQYLRVVARLVWPIAMLTVPTSHPF